MRIKIRDEKAFYREKMRQRNVMRRKIMDEYGENTRKTRTIIKCLRNEAMRQKTVMRQKYEKKLEFLRQKYGGGSVRMNWRKYQEVWRDISTPRSSPD